MVLAFAENQAVIDVLDFRAPASESEPRALAGLWVRVHDALANRSVERLGLWLYEGPPGRGVAVTTARTPMRAEAVVLGVAGELGVEVVEFSPTSVRRLGQHKSNDAAATAIAADLDGNWSAEAARAVAAIALL